MEPDTDAAVGIKAGIKAGIKVGIKAGIEAGIKASADTGVVSTVRRAPE